MTLAYQSLMSAALQLAPDERCQLATNLWESTRIALDTVDEDLEALLDQREADLEQDTANEMSHKDFMDHFATRRRA